MSDRKAYAILVLVLAGLYGGVKATWWWAGQPSRLPSSMPRDSVWIPGMPLPISWHRGWWFGCWIDTDGHSNRCRLYDKQVLYDDLYVSCDDKAPVRPSELKLKPPPDSS